MPPQQLPQVPRPALPQGPGMDPALLLASLGGLMAPGAGAGAPLGAVPPPSPLMPGAEPAPNASLLGPTGVLGLAALERLRTQEPSGDQSLVRVRQALELAQQLVAAVLPLVARMRPGVAKELNVIGRQIADARLYLDRLDEEEAGPPPASMMAAMMPTGVPGGV